MKVTGAQVKKIITDSGLVLDTYGLAYFHNLEVAEREYGEHGVKVQILYILNNSKPAKTEAQKEAKKTLKKLAK